MTALCRSEASKPSYLGEGLLESPSVAHPVMEPESRLIRPVGCDRRGCRAVADDPTPCALDEMTSSGPRIVRPGYSNSTMRPAIRDSRSSGRRPASRCSLRPARIKHALRSVIVDLELDLGGDIRKRAPQLGVR